MTVGDGNEAFARGPGDRADLAEDPLGHLDQIALVDIRHCPVHGVQHSVGDYRGARDGNKRATVIEGHFRWLSKDVSEQRSKLAAATAKARRHLLMGWINVVDVGRYLRRRRQL
jgi:hypothetical protein